MADSLLDLGGTSLWYPEKIINWRQLPDLDFDLARQISEFPGSAKEINWLSGETPQKWSFQVLLGSKLEEHDLLEAFVNTFRARTKRFWFPVPVNQFTLVSLVPAGAEEITVEENNLEYRGYERFFMELVNGDRITRKITGVDRVSGTINLSVAAMPEVQVADVVFFGLLALCRFEQDSLRLSHETAHVSSTTVKMLELMEYSQV